MKAILFPGNSEYLPHLPASPNSLAMSQTAFVLCFPISAWMFQGSIYIFIVSDPKEGNECEMTFIFPFYHQFLSFFQNTEKLFSHSGQSSQLTRKALLVIYINRWMEKNSSDDNSSQLPAVSEKDCSADLKPQQMYAHPHGMVWGFTTKSDSPNPHLQ